MHIGYFITFGWYKNPPGNPENIKKMYSSFKEACKKHNLTLVFYGGPFGVPEPAMYVLKGKAADWEKAIGDVSFGNATPLDRTRTVLVWDFE